MLDPNRKPMSPEQWDKVRRQVRENARRLPDHREKKAQTDSDPPAVTDGTAPDRSPKA